MDITCSSEELNRVLDAVLHLQKCPGIKHMPYALVAKIADMSDSKVRIALKELVGTKRLYRFIINGTKKVARYYYTTPEQVKLLNLPDRT